MFPLTPQWDWALPEMSHAGECVQGELLQSKTRPQPNSYLPPWPWDTEAQHHLFRTLWLPLPGLG